ncbi:Protein phosphatase PP2A regulatory subunit B [Haplosporangium sp. Z 27]|nr:Protein phosphatase PP2A regulatory subunit B [Haplosporangium sp. Z 27]
MPSSTECPSKNNAAHASHHIRQMDTNHTNLNSSTPRQPIILRTLIVDNYDSYTFNLLQLFDQDQLENVVVIRNDQFTWPHFEQNILPHFDQIILSPGPGRPERTHDFGICTQILKTSHIPIFGVCLGHQGIGWMHGAKVTYGPEPVHGQIAHIKHDSTGIFQGIPQDFEAVRYHSLVIQEQDLPTDLIPTAWCYSFPLIIPNNVNKESVAATMASSERASGYKSIMGIRHKHLPHHGVQFHPESICTQYGKTMMRNFFYISLQFYEQQQSRSGRVQQTLPDHIRTLSVIPTRPTLPIKTLPRSLKESSNPYSLIIRALDPTIYPEPESVFSSLFLTGPRSKAASWWLDSARQPHPMSRFSFMGGIETRSCHSEVAKSRKISGAAQAVTQYSTLHKEIHLHQYRPQSKDPDVKRIKLTDERANDTVVNTFWDWISNTMAGFGRDNVETVLIGPQGERRNFEEVPFDFFAGMVGYFGYEMKRESLDGYSTPIEQQCHCLGHAEDNNHCTCDCLRQPDASFLLAAQAVVFDHAEKRIYVLGVVNNLKDQHHQNIGAPIGFENQETCRDWIEDVVQSITHLATCDPTATTKRRKSMATAINSGVLRGGEPYLVKQSRRRRSSIGVLSPCKVDVTEEDYVNAIRESLHHIHEGDSYEICLTTQFRTKLPLYQQKREHDGDETIALEGGDPAYDLYKILRKLNPAPFSAFLSLPTVLSHQTSKLQHPGQSASSTDDLVGKLLVLSSSPERFLKIGRKPSDEPEVVTDSTVSEYTLSTRTVEMKPIKGTVAVAKGCFCREDEGCRVDDGDNSSDPDQEEGSAEHGDRCVEARRRENQYRIDSLSKNIKERAENLMIVDLIRNDLAHVCSSKSVRVPYLMNVESYETVHQLVTTVRGELFDHVDSAQAVKACFPPGSMTGAPKLRSVQLLDSLENHVKRGIYSGCIGYIGIPAVAAATRYKSNLRSNGNTSTKGQRKVRSAVDFAVVIRTAVLSVGPSYGRDGPTTLIGDLSVGAGGALTILSDANEEWREVLLKSRSVVPSVLTYLHQNT